MMKRSRMFILMLVIGFLPVMLTGCGSHKEEITATAEIFLQGLVDADVEAVSGVCDEALWSHEETGIEMIAPSVIESYFFSSLGIEDALLSEEIQTAVTELCESFAKSIFDNYSIVNVTEKDDTGIVIANITTFAGSDVTDPFQSEQLNTATDEYITRYQEENIDALLQVYLTEGEEAMHVRLYNDLLPELIGIVQEALLNIEKKEVSIVFKVSNVDEKWLVTEFAVPVEE